MMMATQRTSTKIRSAVAELPAAVALVVVNAQAGKASSGIQKG